MRPIKNYTQKKRPVPEPQPTLLHPIATTVFVCFLQDDKNHFTNNGAHKIKTRNLLSPIYSRDDKLLPFSSPSKTKIILTHVHMQRVSYADQGIALHCIACGRTYGRNQQQQDRNNHPAPVSQKKKRGRAMAMSVSQLRGKQPNGNQSVFLETKAISVCVLRQQIA